MMKGYTKLLLFSFLLFAASQAQAQYYRVYGWETPRRGWLELNMWNKYVSSSDNTFSLNDQQLSRKGLFLHTAEVEYGITDRLAVGSYVDFRDSPDMNFSFYRFRAVARYRLFSKFEYFFNPAIYMEYYVPRKNSGEATELETRLILQHDFGDFRLNLNPAIEKDLSGEEVQESLKANLFTGLYWRRYYTFQPGLEYYGRFGEVQEFPEQQQREHVLFGVLNMRFFSGFMWELGAGKGLTDGSDNWVFKSILTYEFPTIRPSRQAR